MLGPMLAQKFTPTIATNSTPTNTHKDVYSSAITEQYAKDCMMESLISLSGMQSDTTPKPEFFEMTVRAREAALEKAVRGISKGDDDDDSDDDEERGIGASAELPVGVPMWPQPSFSLKIESIPGHGTGKSWVKVARRSKKAIYGSWKGRLCRI